MSHIKPKILCVDDEPSNLTLLQRMLMLQDYEVITTEKGSEVLSLINKHHVDLVLTDIMMPEVDGFDICRSIKSDEKLRHIPVVMITGLTSKQDRITGIKAGAEDFLSKPFDRGEVLARIAMLLKMKGLADDLSCAYANINSLTSFGKVIIEKFNPLLFDFSSQMDAVVNQIIRQTTDDFAKPQTILVGTTDQNNAWSWYQYEFAFNELDRALVQSKSYFGTIFNLPGKGMSRTVFFNKEDIPDSELQHFFDDLVSFNIKVSNAVCYLSRDVCIHALNYERNVSAHDAAVLDSLVFNVLFLKSLSSQLQEIGNAFEYTVYALARASDVNDEDTGNHILRVGEYSALIARRLKMPDEFVRTIRIQAALHDVGKMHITHSILKKADKLTSAEWIEMKKHTLFGSKIIGDHARLRMGKSIALNHHERWDGSGYPKGVKGDAIPIEGLIVSIADQYDALRNRRSYKPAFDHTTAYKILTEGDERTLPRHFDPRVLKAFKETDSKFEEIYEKLKN